MEYNWWSIEWLNPFRVIDLDWEQPWMLFLLLLLPLVYYFFNKKRKHTSFATGFDLSLMSDDPKIILRHIPNLLFGLALLLVVIALARPGNRSENTEIFGEGIDIVLLMDISGSMEQQDFKPNRLEVAKQVAINFIEGREHDRIGSVIFSKEAIPYVPLTTDHGLAKDFIKSIYFNQIPSQGTAIGEALGKGIVMLEKSEATSKVFILLSDGENSEKIDPISMAKLAYTHNIKIYTIGVGKEGTYSFRDDFGFEHTQKSSLDESTLRKIANIGKGKFFRATDNNSLSQIFQQIDLLEKSKVQTSTTFNFQERYHPFVYWALWLIIAWGISKSTFVSNALED